MSLDASTPNQSAQLASSSLSVPPPPASVASTHPKTVQAVNVQVDGVEDNIAHIVLSVEFKRVDGEEGGKKKQKIKFDFDFNNDSGLSIATEMVAALNLPNPEQTTMLIKNCIDGKVAALAEAYTRSKALQENEPVNPAQPNIETPHSEQEPNSGLGLIGKQVETHIEEGDAVSIANPEIEAAAKAKLAEEAVHAVPEAVKAVATEEVTTAATMEEPVDTTSRVGHVASTGVRESPLDPIDLSSSDTQVPTILILNTPNSSTISPTVVASSPSTSSSRALANEKLLKQLHTRTGPNHTATISVKQLKKQCFELGATKEEVESCYEKQDLKALLQKLMARESSVQEDLGPSLQDLDPFASISQSQQGSNSTSSSEIAHHQGQPQSSSSKNHTPEKTSPESSSNNSPNTAVGSGGHPPDSPLGIQKPPDDADEETKNVFKELVEKAAHYKRKLSIQAQKPKPTSVAERIDATVTDLPIEQPVGPEELDRKSSSSVHSMDRLSPEEEAAAAKQKVEKEAQAAEANLLGNFMNDL